MNDQKVSADSGSSEDARRKAHRNSRTLRQWQRTQIEKGIRQADAGKFASDAEVARAFARRRSSR